MGAATSLPAIGIRNLQTFSTRGFAALAALCCVAMGGSTEALGQSADTLNLPTLTASARSTVTSAPTPAASKATTVDQIAREAAWLRGAGWHLAALVDRFSAGAPLSEEAQCMAVAVYHEARGESLEGQLAVARVIMNRAVSGKYPASWCGVVKQPWQFSFVNPRTGVMPGVDAASAAWRKAQGITRLAMANAVPSLSTDTLWYHADYVAPSWGRRLQRAQKIGTHIFYRS